MATRSRKMWAQQRLRSLALVILVVGLISWTLPLVSRVEGAEDGEQGVDRSDVSEGVANEEDPKGGAGNGDEAGIDGTEVFPEAKESQEGGDEKSDASSQEVKTESQEAGGGDRKSDASPEVKKPEATGEDKAERTPAGKETLPDLDPKGKCSKEIKKFCTKASETSLDCISRELDSEQAGNTPDDGMKVSEGCKEEWRDLKVSLYKDVTLSKNIGAACENDIKKTCSDDFLPNGVLACLREAKDELSQACQEEVFVAEKDAVYDFKMDPLLSQTCSGDAEKYCMGVSPGEGRIQTCLRNHPDDISYSCKAELFRQEIENAGDLRLNVELYKACLNDKQKFCPNVHPGDSQLKDCLENNRLAPEFTSSCKVEFDKMLARRSADFRLNPMLKQKCESDIKLICGSETADISDIPNEEPSIIHCLQDYKDDLVNNECKNEVHKLLALAAEDYRFDKEFSDSCEVSRQKLCKEVDNDKVLPCLQSKRELLDNTCRGALFTMEWRLSGDIDYKFAMKQACAVETGKFCHGFQHDHGYIIECLQQKVDDADMGPACRNEVVADELESAKDYRLNYRIYKDCQKDVNSFCSISKTCKGSEPCGGVVLKCLQDNLDHLKSESCKQDIVSFEVKESKNNELNVPLQKACQDDLKKFCPMRKSNDHSKSLACLRVHRNKLTDACKEEELRFSMMEASDIRLTPSLMNACGPELGTICQNVSPLNGDAFKCLQLHLESVLMGVPCKVEVDLQGARQASDYRLDVRVRNECKDDVDKFCSGVDKDQEGHALVLKCFIDQYKNLSRGCQTEVAYATRMALWQYKFDSNLTFPCDDVVKKSCNATDAKAIEGVVIGTFGQCLTTLRKRTFDPACRKLVRVATTEGFFIGNSTDADVAAALLKYKELRGGDDLSHSGIGLFWVTTVVAFVAILAVALFRRYSGPPKTYTLVVKGGDL